MCLITWWWCAEREATWYRSGSGAQSYGYTAGEKPTTITTSTVTPWTGCGGSQVNQTSGLDYARIGYTVSINSAGA